MQRKPPKDSQEENRIFELSEPDEVEAAFRELPNEEDTISLFRMYDQGRPKFVDKLYPQEFDLKSIRAKYGGGRFKVTALVGDSQVTKVFEIEGDAILSGLNSAPRNPGDGKGYWVKHEDEKPYIFPNTFKEMQEKFKAIETAINDKQPVRDNSSADLLKVIVPFLMGNREDPKKTLFEELNLLKGLIGPSSPVNIETSIIMDAIKMGREMSEGIADGGGGNRIIEVIEKLLNHPVTLGIINAVKNSQAGQTLKNPTPTSTTAPTPGPDVLRPPETPTGFGAVAPFLTPHINSFIASASAGSDPNILVDMALPLLPKDKWPIIIDWLKSPAWFTDLMTLDPRIEVQSAWWRGFAEVLLQALTEPEVIPPENESETDRV